MTGYLRVVRSTPKGTETEDERWERESGVDVEFVTGAEPRAGTVGRYLLWLFTSSPTPFPCNQPVTAYCCMTLLLICACLRVSCCKITYWCFKSPILPPSALLSSSLSLRSLHSSLPSLFCCLRACLSKQTRLLHRYDRRDAPALINSSSPFPASLLSFYIGSKAVSYPSRTPSAALIIGGNLW